MLAPVTLTISGFTVRQMPQVPTRARGRGHCNHNEKKGCKGIKTKKAQEQVCDLSNKIKHHIFYLTTLSIIWIFSQSIPDTELFIVESPFTSIESRTYNTTCNSDWNTTE